MCRLQTSLVCRKDVASHSILYQFSKCLLDYRCSGITYRLKQDNEFKYRACASQETNKVGDYLDMK